jgi:small subunit ribosomal protein S6
MKTETNNLYEGMFIFNAMLSEDARTAALEKITVGITNQGGTICHIIEMGRRRLAYEITGHNEGHYYLLYFEVVPSAIAKLWKEYHLNEDLIRFMTLSADAVRENLEFKPLAIQL